MSEMTIIDGTLAVIGGGRMGEAIISGLLESGAIDPGSVIVAEPSPERRAVLVESYGIRCVATGQEAVLDSAIVVLAVKPQVMDSVVAGLAGSVGSAVVVSIAAGISCARIESLLPAGTVVVRVMPNTPAMVGQAMSVVSAGSEATDEQTRMVCTL
ncbi:MAG: NAD(P)-binding domain-containing protein, partial [Actinobacteria bacterium]|nr:NAD(P)-binding domain-containing protein [Actinomycetota bacterium]